jgi:general secretion pathway protein G
MFVLWSHKGFTLVELVIVIVVIGILATVAMKSGIQVYETARVEQTRQELDALAAAIVGSPDLQNNGVRTDFGFVGDIGNLPPDLDALYSNPGGYTTWNGPYISNRFTQTANDYRTDAWGVTYGYGGGVTIVSTGSGSNIVRRAANSAGDLLYNPVSGNIFDLDGTPPGVDYRDSITVLLTVPDGVGGITSRLTTLDAGGYFAYDSVPIGNHDLLVVYEPDGDTLSRFVSVLPGSNVYGEYRLPRNVWAGAASPGIFLVLRPDGDGPTIQLTSDGCGSNYQCVDESSADGDATRLIRTSNTWAYDLYSLEDPSIATGTIMKVTVWSNARLSQMQGGVMLGVDTYGSSYWGADQTLTTSYLDYSEEWTTNPGTGAAWTWQEVTDLTVIFRMRGQNANFPAYCTQVWVEVTYD